PKGLSSNERDYVLPKLRDLFEREKTVLEALGEAHPYKQIPRMIDHFEQWNEFFYVQEFINGKTLDDRGHGYMSQRSEADVKLLLVDILEVLAFVHQKSVVHRDLKPQNIMRRTADQKIVLIDFGAVKDLSNIGLNRNNRPNSSLVIGTPGYMSPEQKEGKPQLASDVYAIGALGLHALTGIMPTDLFNADILAFEWMHRVRVSPEFAAVLNKMVT
ncbi:MAG: protein kinase domain-containing protein, partial [Pseudanabaenaceae cyanobacterium]